MKTLSMFAVTGMLALAAVPAAAQTKTLTGETKTVTASVEAIDKATRAVTVKKPDGTCTTCSTFRRPSGGSTP